jgi:subtilisin-like proprotein convertase family protein
VTGDWRLVVIDNYDRDAGTLNSWRLQITVTE